MEPENLNERYQRQLQLPGFGPEAQQKLADAKVLVVGAGGLGVPVLQYLCGMGVGAIGIVDGDSVSLSNLHRQVLYGEGDVGRPKAVIAASKLRALNSRISVLAFPVVLSADNALQFIRVCDIVVDATDNFSARYLINDACVILGKPFVYGAVHQFEGHVSTFNYGGGPTYRCLFPVPPAAAEIPDCNAAGVLGVVPGIIGCRQALEVVKIITGIGENLSGHLLVLDFLADTQYKMKLKAVPENKRIKALHKSYDAEVCTPVSQKLSPQMLQDWYNTRNDFIIVDIRPNDQFAAGHLPGAVSCPAAALAERPDFLSEHRPVVLYCRKGVGSAKAAALLHQRYPALQLFELAGGMNAWLQQNFTT